MLNVMRLLVEEGGADVDIAPRKSSGSANDLISPLEAAARRENVDAVAFLLSKGASATPCGRDIAALLKVRYATSLTHVTPTLDTRASLPRHCYVTDTRASPLIQSPGQSEISLPRHCHVTATSLTLPRPCRAPASRRAPRASGC